MSKTLVLSFKPNDRSIDRIDYDVATGELDVKWKLSEQVYRYASSFGVFEQMVRGGKVGQVINEQRQNRKPGVIGVEARLSALAGEVMDVTAETLPPDLDAVKASWAAKEFARINDLSALVDGAVFG